MGGAVTLGPGCWVSDHRMSDDNLIEIFQQCSVLLHEMTALSGLGDIIETPQLLLLICTIKMREGLGME